MSRAYRVRVSESITETVHVEDGVCAALELLPVLAKERMGDLLGAELEKRGFHREGNVAVRTEADGIVVSVDLATSQVTVRVAADQEVTKGSTQEVALDTDSGEPGRARGEAEARAGLRERLQREAQAEKGKLTAEITKRLERKVVDLQAELGQAVNRVTADALKERAGQLGQIEQIVEEPNGGMTIKVRL